MKKMFLALLLSSGLRTWAQDAHSSSLNLDTRMDHVSFSPNRATGKSSYSTFQISRLKINYRAKLGKLNRIRLQVDPLKSSNTPSTRDKSSAYIQVCYLTRILSNRLYFNIGKLETGMGGIEGHVSRADTYLGSTAGDEVVSMYHPMGAQLEIRNGSTQRLRLNMTNVSEDNSTNSTYDQTGSLYGFTFDAKFFNGKFAPNLSYHSESYSANSVKKINSYTAIGARAIWQEFELETDFLKNTFKLDPQSQDDVLDTQTIVGLVRYRFNSQNSFHLKFESSQQKMALDYQSEENQTIAGSTAAYEYKPIKDENWRAHIAFTNKETQRPSYDRKVEQFVYVGLRMVANMLK